MILTSTVDRRPRPSSSQDMYDSYTARQPRTNDKRPNEREYMDRYRNPLGYYDLTSITLKQDHQKYPLWILLDNIILIETFSPAYRIATEFLIAVAEPRKRPALIHEYEFTPNSLYASVSLNYDTKKILSILRKLAKNLLLPQEVETYIKEHTEYYGQARLVLHDNKYYIECFSSEVFDKLRSLAIVRKHIPDDERKVIVESEIISSSLKAKVIEKFETISKKPLDQVQEHFEKLTNLESEEKDSKQTKKNKIYRFEIPIKDYKKVKEECNRIKLPLKEEYDYLNIADRNKILPMKLKSTTKVRNYQAKALGKMFRNNRAQNGIIVLPCGAGKSLVGVCSAANVKQGTICFCNSTYSVKQWAAEFRYWTDIDPKRVIEFTSKRKNEDMLDKKLDKPVILVTTYGMLFRDSANADLHIDELLSMSDKIKNKIKKIEWGLCILDEVHVAPADKFSKAVVDIKSHCKLGLTATLLREDNKIGNLEFLIGPKLHEENWKDLELDGYLARVLCVEIRCEMLPSFRKKYEATKDKKVQRKIYNANPEKFWVLQSIIRYHEQRKDKILVFSQSLFILKKYAELLNKTCVYGEISNADREKIFENFRTNPEYNVIFLSSVGDTSIDLPDANVLIEISAQYGSRRQTTQRLGRVLRPKPTNKERFNAFFYSIVSQVPEDLHFATKRQTFLINQGYTFKILPSKVIEKKPLMFLSTPEEQEQHLQESIEDKAT